MVIPRKQGIIFWHVMIYCILQIVWGGKVSRLQNSTVICWKTFAVGPSLLFFFYNLLSEGNYFAGKVSWLPTDPRKPQNFSTSNNLQYTVLLYSYYHIQQNFQAEKLSRFLWFFTQLEIYSHKLFKYVIPFYLHITWHYSSIFKVQKDQFVPPLPEHWARLLIVELLKQPIRK